MAWTVEQIGAGSALALGETSYPVAGSGWMQGGSANDLPHERILGVPFFTGTASQAVDRMLGGGLLVVPSAPTLKDLPLHPTYRDAVLNADLVIPDSAFMVLTWNALERKRMRRLSGLEYLRELLQRPEVRVPGSTVWIMAGERSAKLNLDWLKSQGIDVPESHVYLAPMYGPADGTPLVDPALLDKVAKLRPDHVIVTVGGGTQERLGLYLRGNLDYVPGIHCIGAAIAFLSGDQTAIPVWADKLYLGWLLRILDNPRQYGPRYWAATRLLQLIVKYRSNLPPLSI